jgi:sulfatase maturation enzyme AslB (radical SAM superfamily)
VTLLLTGRCNLSCSYCYQQHDRTPGAMPWEVARSALDWLLAAARERCTVEFSGGEPLLEFNLLQRAVEYVEGVRPANLAIRYAVTSNGTLSTPAILDFLAAHGIVFRLSFDGPPAAQRFRGRRTFEILDALLERLRRSYPAYLEDRLEVGVTLLAATISTLPAAVRYFIAAGVRCLYVSPCMTLDPDWSAGRRDELSHAVDEVTEISLQQWKETGRVPVAFLAGAAPGAAVGTTSALPCGGTGGQALCVDPLGQVYGCPAFAPSLRELPAFAVEASLALALGRIEEPGLSERLAALPGRARAIRGLTGRRAKRSSYGRCDGCPFAAECFVCPASIRFAASGDDRDRIPDLVCAFNQAAISARRRFQEIVATATPRSKPVGEAIELLRGFRRDASRARAAASDVAVRD